MHWGHARSRDLVHWQHLPIALWPSEEMGESHVFSGCTLITPKGQPLAFYTSIAQNKPAEQHAEQWMALGDKDLLSWHKYSGNPVMTESLHGAGSPQAQRIMIGRQGDVDSKGDRVKRLLNIA